MLMVWQYHFFLILMNLFYKIKEKDIHIFIE